MTRGGEALVCGGGSVAHQRRDVAQQGARARANTYYYTVSCPFDGGVGGGGVSQRTRRELAMTLVHAVHRVRTLGRGATSNRRGGTTACAGVVVSASGRGSWTPCATRLQDGDHDDRTGRLRRKECGPHDHITGGVRLLPGTWIMVDLESRMPMLKTPNPRLRPGLRPTTPHLGRKFGQVRPIGQSVM